MFKNNFSPSIAVRDFFERCSLERSREELNFLVRKVCGIEKFFENKDELSFLKACIHRPQADEPLAFGEREREFGDFQTNPILAERICRYLLRKGCVPETLIEPTCGRGGFVLAALEAFPSLRRVVCVEIQSSYVRELKYAILDFYLSARNKELVPPKISIFCADVFTFNFSHFASDDGEILILGNPPWVTNSDLGALGSQNLPRKTNYKKNSGLDAMTGKANFDLGEFVLKTMLENFSDRRGHIAFLLKNSVVKNTVHAQPILKFPIGEMEQLGIDASVEFDADVNASLFFAKFAVRDIGRVCENGDFYTGKGKRKFGWVGEKFVSDVDAYGAYAEFDGLSPLVWRQGVKHDCAKILELDACGNNVFANMAGERVELEPAAVFGLLKSSDLKLPRIRNPRKYSMLTQTRINEPPAAYLSAFPKAWAYLKAHESAFAARKSSIYRNRPPFSMFGIGDYTLAPYKVAISGFYKQTRFSLVYPHAGKPMLLDDTCYFLGFACEADAEFVLELLNSDEVQKFLASLVFFDSKRGITKDVLMRIDLKRAAKAQGRTVPHEFEFFRAKKQRELPLIF